MSETAGGRRETRGTRSLLPLAPYIVAAVVVGLTWPVEHRVDFPIFDTFWQASLHVAANEGRNFGRGFAFTWGPLGFMSWPQAYYSGTATVATVVLAGAFYTALALVARRLCRSLGLAAGALATFAVARLAYPAVELPELLEAIFMVLCVSLVLDRERELSAPAAVGLATLAAFTLLVKVSAGTVNAALLLIVLALPVLEAHGDRRVPARTVALGLTAYLVALASFWLAARQSLGELPQYLADSLQLILGYSSAAAMEAPGRGREYIFAIGSMVTIGALVAGAARALPPARRWVLATLFAVYLFLLFRHGFTRHDEHSLFAFFAPVLVAGTAFVRPGLRMLSAVASVPLVLGCLSQREALDVFHVSPGRTADTLSFVASAGTRAHAIEATRQAFRLRHGVPAAALARIGGQPLHIDLSESSVAWAYPKIDWTPLPVLQSWNAYTHPLDEKNARFLASGAAPHFILRRAQTGAADRNPRFESPEATVEIVCRYREVGTYATWQLLEHGPNRCEEPGKVGSRRVRFGVPVAVPAGEGSGIVAASFTDIHQPVTQTLLGLLLKKQVVSIGLGAGRASRFLMGNASSLHAMRLPACLGYDPLLFDSHPYESVVLSRGGLKRAAHPTAEQSGSFVVTFYELPFRC